MCNDPLGVLSASTGGKIVGEGASPNGYDLKQAFAVEEIMMSYYLTNANDAKVLTVVGNYMTKFVEAQDYLEEDVMDIEKNVAKNESQ